MTRALMVLLAASLCLGARCPLYRTQAPGAGPQAVGDSIGKILRPPNLGSGRPARGLIDGIFDRGPGQSYETPGRSGYQSQQPYIDMMRHAYGPGRQAYEEPLPEERPPAPVRSRHRR